MQLIKNVMFLLAVSFMANCNIQNSNQLNYKHDLIDALINSKEAQISKLNGKIIILETSYCKLNDCDNYFKNYKDKIAVFSKAEAFLTSHNNYLVVDNIDEDKEVFI